MSQLPNNPNQNIQSKPVQISNANFAQQQNVNFVPQQQSYNFVPQQQNINFIPQQQYVNSSPFFQQQISNSSPFLQQQNQNFIIPENSLSNNNINEIPNELNNVDIFSQ